MLRVEHMWSDKLTPDYFYYAAVNQHIQLWGVGEDAIQYVAVTQVKVYPASRFLEVDFIFGSGDVDACVEALYPVLHNYAQVQGCRCIEIINARDGWVRKLKHKAKKTGVVLTAHVGVH